MSPTGRKDGEGERYRAILETAARLICERGYEGTSMQEVAAACRMTKAGLYHHIQSKEQLLAAIMSFGMDMFEQQVLVQVRDMPDALERLRECMRRNILLVTRDLSKEVTIILHEHATLHGEARDYIDGRKKRYVRFLETSFAEAVREGRIRAVDPTVAAFSFLGQVLWIYKWYRPDGRLTDEQIADGMVDLFFGGLAVAERQSAPGPRGQEPEAAPLTPVVPLFAGKP
ncbi:MAG: TetR/AcrR family transcriptional regulator [Myxococcaceae bacterium]|nr:TetR/AcrR family transcriptional regulator [Myxococcaceae bacterium]MCI0671596.1 TetR/AcrR family transcriptional regulator [Myxococcaceae bacterium]